MKVALCQINPTVGALSDNVRKIIDVYNDALNSNCDIIVFPELAITGYPPQDLLLNDKFIEANSLALNKIVKHVTAPAIIGYVREQKGNLHNTAALACNGKIVYEFDKILLPTYDVFDEKRYFKSGKVPSVFSLNIKGKKVKIGVQVCEDLWDDKYDLKVSNIQKQNGADLIINISASPFRENKFKDRVNLVRSKVNEIKIPFLYCNLVGAQDELVFDGSSFALDKNGNCISHCNSFEEDVLYIDLESHSTKHIKYATKCEDLFNALCLGIKDYFKKTKNKEAVIGLSGGIDSAVVACIASYALGNKSVYGVSMPSKFSSEHSKFDAEELAKNLNINYQSISIQNIVDKLEEELSESFSDTVRDVTEENIQSRVRGNLLMALSNKFGRLVLSTGNKTELALGYCTLYGDMSGGLSVISDLNKSDVYELAEWINNNKNNPIPLNTINKPPSAELSPDQVDPFDYEVISPLVDFIVEKQFSAEELINKGFDKDLVKETLNKITINEYKRRQAPIGIRVSNKAFGIGRRYPIINHFREEVS
jgi:NAD+ synthase (glutamine-hydrolysing)